MSPLRLFLYAAVLTSLTLLLFIVGEEVIQVVLWCLFVFLLLLMEQNKPAFQTDHQTETMEDSLCEIKNKRQAMCRNGKFQHIILFGSN